MLIKKINHSNDCNKFISQLLQTKVLIILISSYEDSLIQCNYQLISKRMNVS